MYLSNIIVTSVLPLLISAEAAAYAEYHFRTCNVNQFNKNVIILMQKMFLCLTKISCSNFKKERERDKVPVLMYAFLDILLEEGRELLKLLISH